MRALHGIALRTAFVAGALALVSAVASEAQPPPSDSVKAQPVIRSPLPAPGVKPAGREAQLQIGGLVQAQGEFGEKGDSRFSNGNDRLYLRRTRLNAAGRFNEGFEFKVELELTGSLAAASGLRAQLTDGYAAWTRHPQAMIRGGQFKTPFGFEQLFSDSRLAFIERTMASDRLGIGRQPGVQASGDLAGKRASYALGTFNGTGSNTSGNDDDKFLGALRVGLTPWRQGSAAGARTISTGGNVYYSDDAAVALASDFQFDSTPGTPALDDVFAGHRVGLGADVQAALGPLEIWMEYLRTRFEPRNDLPAPRLTAEGWYAQVGWMLLADRLQTAARFESFDPNTDADGTSTETWTLGLNYFVAGHDVKILTDYLQTTVPGVAGAERKLLARLQTAF